MIKRNIFAFLTFLFFISYFTNTFAQTKSQNAVSVENSETKKEIEIDNDNVVKLLFNKDKFVSEKAQQYIEKNKPSKIIPNLFEYLSDVDNKEYFSLIFNCIEFYNLTETNAYWIKSLKEIKNPEIKVEIIKRYGKYPDRRIVYPLSNQLDDTDFRVREAACIELEKIRNDRTFAKVFGMATSNNPVMKLYAVQALYYLYDKRFVEVVRDLMQEKTKSVRIYSLKIIEKKEIDNLYYLVRSAAQKDENYEVKIEAMRILISTSNKSAYYIFSRNITDDNVQVRYAAAQAVLKVHYSGSVYSALKQLEIESDNRVKDMLLNVVVKYRKGGNFRGLKKIIENENSPHLKAKAVYAVSSIGGYIADDILLKSLKDSDYRVRAESASGLKRFKSSKVVDALIDTLRNDRERYVRTAALYSLEKIRSKKAVDPLIEILAKEKDPVVRKIIRDCLKQVYKKDV